MKLKTVILFVIIWLSGSMILFSQAQPSSPDSQPDKTGLIIKTEQAFKGYTLFSPIALTSTYLIDLDGRLVHSWECDYEPGQAVYLLENGHLLRTAFAGPGSNPTFSGGGSGGRVQEFSWEGDLLWDFTYNNKKHQLHHDIAKLPNGNVLMIAWEHKTRKQAVAAGRNPESVGDSGLWPDSVIEVKPVGKTKGKIVWEWHIWDHLVQDFDSSRKNYGSISENPQLINLNPGDWTKGLTRRQMEKLASLGYLQGVTKQDPRESHPDWTHINSIDYNPELDQIVLSVLGFNEIWIIDHSTTTKEAGRHSGGRRGRGGDLLYRWGNPRVYGRGKTIDRKLFAQHDARWIPSGTPGAGHLLVFNNGRGRPDGEYSTVEEIVTPVNRKGQYLLAAGASFGPENPTWIYGALDKPGFYSGHISGAQRLANGNTLICSGENGTLFEITRKGDTVWKYVNPLKVSPRPPTAGEKLFFPVPPPEIMKPGPKNFIFRVSRYAASYQGLKGKDLTPKGPLEKIKTPGFPGSIYRHY